VSATHPDPGNPESAEPDPGRPDPAVTLRALIAGVTSAGEEGHVLDLLHSLDDEQLSSAVAGVDAGDLFGSVDDRVFGPDRRTALRELFRSRASGLSVAARASLLYGLQRGHTSDADEELMRDLFLAVGGRELTEVKNAINMRTDAHDLEGLVFEDIDSDEIRDAILAHFAAEAPAVGIAGTKVLSDIDDTAFSRIHEKRYPKGEVIPGILAVYEALDLGTSEPPFSRGDLAFVTARPDDALSLIEGATRESLAKAGLASVNVIGGSFLALRSKDDMAAKKVANIDNYSRLFPEYRIVFIGDSGQGDPLTGETILQQHPESVATVIIHDVVATSSDERAEWAAKGLHFVDTYVGAAPILREMGLICPKQVARIAEETSAALDAIAWESPEQEAAARALVDRDTKAAAPAMVDDRP